MASLSADYMFMQMRSDNFSGIVFPVITLTSLLSITSSSLTLTVSVSLFRKSSGEDSGQE